MSRLLRNSLACTAAVLALGAVALSFRGELLKDLANAWIVHDPLSKADAIIVLDGGMQTRPFEAARLYREGYAPRVLVASPESKPTDKIGITADDTEVTKRILSKQGVPDSAVVEFGDEVSSTYEEALALGSWIRKTGLKKIIIVSDLFHTRRVRWLFKKELQVGRHRDSHGGRSVPQIRLFELVAN